MVEDLFSRRVGVGESWNGSEYLDVVGGEVIAVVGFWKL
jgi:hypothetical protein